MKCLCGKDILVNGNRLCSDCIIPKTTIARKITRKQINAVLPEGYTIEGNYNDEGCYIFVGDGIYGDTCSWYCSSVYVCRLNHLTLEKWLESFMSLAENREG